MEERLGARLKNAWNAFLNKDPAYQPTGYGASYSRRPDRPRMSRGNERSIATAVYNRIAMDAAQISIKHCRFDESERYESTINSRLNNCLTLEANTDQTGRAFIHDAVLSLLDEGVVALVPVVTTDDPRKTASYDIESIRTAKIVEWRPMDVKLLIYNEWAGKKVEIWMPKRAVAIIENPLYAVVNESNSTMQRLIRKLNLLDAVDEQSGSGKLDLIIQLPYMVKTSTREQQATKRIQSIESQLRDSPFGIAYIDGTEKVTQLNRPIENNLLKQIEYLTNMLYSQLGLTQTVLDGTADEKTMLNYYSRTIEPIMAALVDEMNRKFLTKTARTQRQVIAFFRDPFKIVPVNDLAEIVDKFTRNEIMASNEFRQIIGLKPSKDPRADELRNKNLNASSEEGMPPANAQGGEGGEESDDAAAEDYA